MSSATVQALRFGAPPSDLNDYQSPITDFFRAAAFQPVLSQEFLGSYVGEQPQWGPIGYVTYKRTYARPLYPLDLGLGTTYNPDVAIRSEEYWETITRVINGLWHIIRCHSARKNIDFSESTATRKAENMFRRMWEFKWLPPGRGLWMMGTRFMYLKGSAALNNCLAYETEIITSEGIKQIGDLIGQTVTLLTENGKWVDAPVKSFGTQPLIKLTIQRQGIQKEIFATAEHRWFIFSKAGQDRYKRQERYTSELRPGQRLVSIFGQGIKGMVHPSTHGAQHGIVFGDGVRPNNGSPARVMLCGQKDHELLQHFSGCRTREVPDACTDGAVEVLDLPRYFKTLPDLDESKSYLYGWLSGYFAADGSVDQSGQCTIQSSKREHLERVKDICALIGIGTGSIGYHRNNSQFVDGERRMYALTLLRQHLTKEFFLITKHRERWMACDPEETISRHWHVVSIEQTNRIEEVYCPVVPETHSFALADNILTGNCGFVSTSAITKEHSEPFTWAMDMSMLGVGIGFDTRGADQAEVLMPSNLDTSNIYSYSNHIAKHIRLHNSTYALPKRHKDEVQEEYEDRIQTEMAWAVPKNTQTTEYFIDIPGSLNSNQLQIYKTYLSLIPHRAGKKHVIPDTREGWVDSVGIVLDAFLKGKVLPAFDYSTIRPQGSPIKGFGGIAEGPKFLQICHENLTCFLWDRIGTKLTASDIVDIYNEIGACVVSGNVRRSAQISFGEPDDLDFISLKHDFVNHPNSWNSNNSVFASVGMDYTKIAELISTRGEPGLFWIENARAYGRMGDLNNKDQAAMGTNPCAEQTLHNYELCCLVENFPALHENESDFLATLKQSYLYAKAVTLVPSHNKKTNKIMGKNARIGCSLSGIQSARFKFGTRRFLEICDTGYRFICDRDKNYSDWLQVRESIKKTSLKPSGTVSLLAGPEPQPPGIHYDTERTYLRRIRFSKSNPMIVKLQAAGYRVYDAPEQPESTCIVDFPVHNPRAVMTEAEVSHNIWEQLEFNAQLQEVWSDNQNSITVKFRQRPGIAQEIARALEMYETRLKAVSFLPHFESAEDSTYAALPIQAISYEQYLKEIKDLKPYSFSEAVDDLLQESCDNGVCPIR
jgi:ribonucleoside-triphosphate reductase (thioredoxin)